jgi:hypothetical protein
MHRHTMRFALALSLQCLAVADSRGAPPAAFVGGAERAASAAAATLAPATAPWSRDVGGSTVGVALYAAAPLAGRADFIAARGAKRLRIVLRQRMSSEQVSRMLIHDIEQASGRAQVLPHVATLARLGQAMGTRGAGHCDESVSIEYVPDLGTRVWIDNLPASDFLGDAAFFAVMVRPWLDTAAAPAAGSGDSARR